MKKEEPKNLAPNREDLEGETSNLHSHEPVEGLRAVNKTAFGKILEGDEPDDYRDCL